MEQNKISIFENQQLTVKNTGIYKEEQVRDMLHEMKWKHNLTDEQIEYWIEDMISIELPSDTKIIEESYDYANDNNFKNPLDFLQGAKWMRDKIQGGNQ